jgi:hypothetical protein
MTQRPHGRGTRVFRSSSPTVTKTEDIMTRLPYPDEVGVRAETLGVSGVYLCSASRQAKTVQPLVWWTAR